MTRGILSLLAVTCLLLTGCSHGVRVGGLGFLPGSEPSGPPVASFQGYGPIKIGMTEAEASAAVTVPVTRNHYYNCTVLTGEMPGGGDWRHLAVWIEDASGRVTGIDLPAGAKTDRGVGDGSTVSAIQAAYAGDSTITREPSLGGHETLRVQPNDPGAGQFLAFQVDGDTAGQPHVGRTPGSEGCRLATATPSATPGPQQCGLYKTDQGDYALVVQSGSASCDTARTLFDRMFRGEGKSLSRQSVQIGDYKCTGNSAGAFDETGVLSYCEQVGIRIELRKP